MPKNKSRISRTPDAEDKKAYFKVADFFSVKVKFNASENTLFEDMMSRMHATNKSRFIKLKLFGLDPDERLLGSISKDDPQLTVLALKNAVSFLGAQYAYFLQRYNKDMSQLYKEEGVDVRKWIAATNRWHSEMCVRTDQTLNLLRRICEKLGLNDPAGKESGQLEIVWPDSREDYNRLDEEARKMYEKRLSEGEGENI